MTKKSNVKMIVGIIVFCIGAMATNMTMGILALIMQSYPSVSPVIVQTVLVGPPLVGTIYGFFVGNLNKKIPCKNLLIFGQATLLLYGLIFLLGGGKIPIIGLILASGLAGFNQGQCYTVLGILMTSAVEDEKKRGTLLGIMISLMSVGGVIFTTIGGVIASFGWQKAYLLFLYFAAAIILEAFLLPKMEPEGKEVPKLSAESAGGSGAVQEAKPQMGRVWLLSIHYFFFFLWLYVFGTNVSEFVINTYKIGGAPEAGLAASCVTIGGIFAGVLFGLYSGVLKRFTLPVLMGLSVIGLALPVFITDSMLGVYIAGLLLGFAMMGASPYITNFMHTLAPGSAYGKAMSVYSGFMNAGMVVAIYIIAFLTQMVCGDAGNIHYKFVVAFVGDILVFITSFFVYVVGVRKEKTAPEDHGAES